MSGPKAVVTGVNLAKINFGEILNSLCLADVFSGTRPEGHILISNNCYVPLPGSLYMHAPLLDVKIKHKDTQ